MFSYFQLSLQREYAHFNRLGLSTTHLLCTGKARAWNAHPLQIFVSCFWFQNSLPLKGLPIQSRHFMSEPLVASTLQAKELREVPYHPHSLQGWSEPSFKRVRVSISSCCLVKSWASPTLKNFRCLLMRKNMASKTTSPILTGRNVQFFLAETSQEICTFEEVRTFHQDLHWTQTDKAWDPWTLLTFAFYFWFQ